MPKKENYTDPNSHITRAAGHTHTHSHALVPCHNLLFSTLLSSSCCQMSPLSANNTLKQILESWPYLLLWWFQFCMVCVCLLFVSLGFSFPCLTCSSHDARPDLQPSPQASLAPLCLWWTGLVQVLSWAPCSRPPPLPVLPGPLLPLAVVCVIEWLLSGSNPELRTQGDTCPNLLFFHQKSQTTVMGSVAWLGAFLIPPTTNLASIPLAGPDYLWFRTSS